jgi:hypothetical protein
VLGRAKLPEGVAGIARLHAVIVSTSATRPTTRRWWSGSRPSVARGCRR